MILEEQFCLPSLNGMKIFLWQKTDKMASSCVSKVTTSHPNGIVGMRKNTPVKIEETRLDLCKQIWSQE